MTLPSIHGHAVLNYILDLGRSEDLDVLRQWATVIHGRDARYHTCSVQGLTFDGLIEFLQKREKIVIADNQVRVIREHICAHDDEGSASEHDHHH